MSNFLFLEVTREMVLLVRAYRAGHSVLLSTDISVLQITERDEGNKQLDDLFGKSSHFTDRSTY